jgi:hypothetical protein
MQGLRWYFSLSDTKTVPFCINDVHTCLRSNHESYLHALRCVGIMKCHTFIATLNLPQMAADALKNIRSPYKNRGIRYHKFTSRFNWCEM